MAKFFKYLMWTLLVLIIIIGVGGFIFIKTFDFNKYKGFVTELASKQLGRELSINGDASVGISLIPTIILEDVELANTPWGEAPNMVTLERLEVKFSILPLLKKQIVIDTVSLVKPEIYLEVAADGKQNWIFDMPSNSPVEEEAVKKGIVIEDTQPNKEVNSANAALAGFAAKNVSIEDGLLNFSDKKNKKQIDLKINSVTMSAESMDADLNMAFDLVYNKDVIKGKVNTGSINTLLEGKKPFAVDLSASAYGVNIDVDGTVTNALKEPSFDVTANIKNPAGNFGAPAATLDAHVAGDMKEVVADIKKLDLANSVITGKVTANISGNIPHINAVLNSDKIDVPSITKSQSTAFVMPSIIASAYASELVPDTAIPFDVLKQVNADAVVKVGQLVIADGMVADNVSLTAKLNNGLLNVNPLKLGFGGGDIEGSMQMNAANQSLALKLASKGMTLQKLHKEFMVSNANSFGIKSGGNLDLDINISGSGSTARRLVNSLDGQLIAIVDESVVQTGKLNFLTGNFITQLTKFLPIKSSNKEMNLNCAVVRADISKGVAKFPRGIAINSSSLSLVSDGTVNLINDKIDLNIKPFSGNMTDINLTQAVASFIKVGGTLTHPSVGIDERSTAKAVIGMAVTGGTSYLGSQLLMEADNSPCYTALKDTKYQDRFPAPTGASAATQNAVGATTQQIKDSVKDIGSNAKEGVRDLQDAAKDILGSFRRK